MIRIALSLAAVALAICPGSARAEPTVSIVPLGFEAEQMRGPATRVAATAASLEAFREVRNVKTPIAVVWGRDGAAALSLDGTNLRVYPAKRGAGDLSALERGRDTPSAFRVGGAGALTVQFEMPTRDYAHEALGSPEHARVLAISERKPSPPSSEPKPVAQDVVRIPAGEGAVFEDREPHLVRLGGADPAILVVRSYRERGSALLVVAKRDGTWRAAAETPADGEPFRWLNPAMSGLDQVRDIAVVRRPHLDGLLQLWRLEGDKLVLRAEKAGYSNHVYGSPAQDLAAWIGSDGGAARLVVPVLDRTALAILAVEPELKEVARIPLPAKAANGVVAFGRGRDAHILVGLEDGRLADIRP